MADTGLTAVVDVYTGAGWIVSNVRGAKGYNDLIAVKNSSRKTVCHFIQVVPEKLQNDSKYTGVTKNSFVQNAFSNNAIPVHAVVKQTSSGAKVSLLDVNTGARVVVRGPKKTAAAPPKPATSTENN